MNRLCRYRTTALALTLFALVLALLSAAGAAPASAAPAPGDELWRDAYDAGGWTDIANALALAPGGKAVYVTGSALINGVKCDLVVIKYRPGGARAWVRTYDGAVHGNDEGTAIVCDRAGNVYVGGSVDTSTRALDFVLVKYDPAGHRRWVRTYDGAVHGNDAISALAVDAVGNVYAAGKAIDSGSSWNATLVKWTPAGKRAWVRRYDGGANLWDEFRAVVVDKTRGRVYVVGASEVDPDTKDWVLARYSTAGKRAWLRTFGVQDHLADPSGLALTARGAPLVAGSAGQGGGVKPDAILAKWTAAGALAWSDGFSSADEDYFADLAVDRHGHIFTAGRTYTPVSLKDGLVCRFSSVGTLEDWVTIGGLEDDFFNHVAVDGAGNVYATGVRGNGNFGSDYMTEKFDHDLDPLWLKITRENDVDWDDVPWDLAVRTGTNPGVYVTGKGSQSAWAWDWLTIKYKP